MNRTGIPYLDFCWNPCGCGCSHGCPTCWARRLATSKGPRAPACAACQAFKVHFHPERLEKAHSPAGRKKPAVIGVQFTGDLFDPQRPREQSLMVLDAALAAPRHECIFLTRQYQLAFDILELWIARRGLGCIRDVWHIGTTCQNQAEYERAAFYFSDSRWNWWVSAEPLTGPITNTRHTGPTGIIIGADNQPGWPFDLGWHRQTAAAFAAAGVKVYVKQLWQTWCPRCGWDDDDGETIVHHAGRCDETPQSKLYTDPWHFPRDLRSRELPWTLTMGAKTAVAGSLEPVAGGDKTAGTRAENAEIAEGQAR